MKRLIDATPIEEELFKLADKALAKNPYEKARICAFRRAFEMVSSAPTVSQPPNDPLTLDELRGMDGEPVAFPCKIGDLLYEVDRPEYGVITCRVLYISYYTGPAGHVPGNPMVSTVSIGVEVISGHGKGSSYCFEQEDIGKLVFLTYQAAEDAILAYRRKPDDAQ